MADPSGPGQPGPRSRAAAQRRTAGRTRTARLTPVAVALLVLVAASAFVTARWLVAADRDVGRFVLAGSAYAGPSLQVPVLPGPGYDGQFAYRLAVAPTQLEGDAGEVALDSPLRLQRITYPALAAALSLGQDDVVPEALVLVNVLALALLALLAAVLARDAGRFPAAGLLVAGFFGFATTLGRDLTEIVTAVLLLAGLLALRRDRQALAALAFSGAVLSRESAVLLYAVLAAVELARRPALGRAAWAALPVAVFVAWQAVCVAVVGQVPLLSSSGKNLVLPLQDLLPAAVGWVGGAAALQRADLITSGQLAALVVLVGAAGLALRRSAALPGVKAAWAGAVLLVAGLSENVWKGPADFRTASELAVLSAVVLLESRAPLRVPAAGLALAGTGTVLFRVTNL